MVQIKRYLPLPEQGKTDNTYWAIGAANTYPAKSPSGMYYVADFVDREQHLNRDDRKELGLLDYEDLKLKELKIFAESRRLGPVHSPRKLNYINLLQAADDDPIFDKFLELPPELRNKIYQQYFRALPPLPTRPHQPPLTLVSRLVRDETLPFYYEESTFAFKVYSRFWYLNDHGMRNLWAATATGPPMMYCHIKRRSLLASGRLRAEDLARIQHVRVHLFHQMGDTNSASGTQFISSWEIDLSGEQGSMAKRLEDSGGRRSNLCIIDRGTVSCRQVTEAITSVITEIRTRPGPGKLLQSDVLAIGAAMFEAVDKSATVYR